VLKFSDLSISSMLCAVALSSSIKSTRIVGPQPRRPHQRADTSLSLARHRPVDGRSAALDVERYGLIVNKT
jgi:hypothetical protein